MIIYRVFLDKCSKLRNGVFESKLDIKSSKVRFKNRSFRTQRKRGVFSVLRVFNVAYGLWWGGGGMG